MVLLKAVQYLGYFPQLTEIPQPIVQTIRISLRLSADLILDYENDRSLRNHQASILHYLGLKPRHGREVADLINTVVERMRTGRCELPSFETLNRFGTPGSPGYSSAGFSPGT